MEQFFLKLALKGDTWVLYLLLAASIASVAVMVERALVFKRRKGDFATLLDLLAARLEAHDVKGALAAAEADPSVEAQVAAEGLRNFGKGEGTAEEVMTARWLRLKVELEKNLIVLGTLGNNAPFIGLFGTVLGIIKAFNDLALSGQGGVSVVMAGISSALVATAFGILVAIPAVVANNYFVTRFKRTQANTEVLSRILLAYLKKAA